MNRLTTNSDLDRLDFVKGGGTVTVVTQDISTSAVLMVAHADREALERSIATGEMHYRSRTRGLWRKGETSGNLQRVVALYHDCDGDAVLAVVTPAGPACHTGTASCFGDANSSGRDIFDRLDATIRARASEQNETSYTRRLLADRNLRLKKIGEEAAEFVLACSDSDRERVVSEAADLLYHTMVALRAVGVGIAEVRATLEQRAGS